MRNIILLAVMVLAVSTVLMAPVGPAYAAQTTVAFSNAGSGVDTVVRTESTVPAQLVRGGTHGASGMRSGSMRSGSFRASGFRGARFNNFRVHNNFRFHNARFRHFRSFVPYYSSYNYNNCYWDGYQWICGDYDYVY